MGSDTAKPLVIHPRFFRDHNQQLALFLSAIGCVISVLILRNGIDAALEGPRGLVAVVVATVVPTAGLIFLARSLTAYFRVPRVVICDTYIFVVSRWKGLPRPLDPMVFLQWDAVDGVEMDRQDRVDVSFIQSKIGRWLRWTETFTLRVFDHEDGSLALEVDLRGAGSPGQLKMLQAWAAAWNEKGLIAGVVDRAREQGSLPDYMKDW